VNIRARIEKLIERLAEAAHVEWWRTPAGRAEIADELAEMDRVTTGVEPAVSAAELHAGYLDTPEPSKVSARLWSVAKTALLSLMERTAHDARKTATTKTPKPRSTRRA
jgi:hypothetical protein